MMKATVVVEGRHRLSLQEIYEEGGVLRVRASTIPSDDRDVPEESRERLVTKWMKATAAPF